MISTLVPLRQRRVFVDSSAYLALLDVDDEHHVQAVEILGQLATARYRQYTTTVLLIEAHALILSTMGVTHAARFLREMDLSSTIVVRVKAGDEERAKQILFRYEDKDFSFSDAISFAVMERFTIASAFTFDRHFARYGFAVLGREATDG